MHLTDLSRKRIHTATHVKHLLPLTTPSEHSRVSGVLDALIGAEPPLEDPRWNVVAALAGHCTRKLAANQPLSFDQKRMLWQTALWGVWYAQGYRPEQFEPRVGDLLVGLDALAVERAFLLPAVAELADLLPYLQHDHIRRVEPHLARASLAMQTLHQDYAGQVGISSTPRHSLGTPAHPDVLRAALFVDFDNIYIGLEKIDPAAAKTFATDPARWLSWIEEGMIESEEDSEQKRRRRSILVRRCYLNPDGGMARKDGSFARYRPFFTRSAFSVIDCPPITQQAKNSADIYMVMDILDMLNHSTRFDEFIILSGDSDFTPVLLRLRNHNRSTAVVTIGPAAEAYKAASDRAIRGDVFTEFALGFNAAFAPAPRPQRAVLNGAHDPLLDSMARRLYEEVSANGDLPAQALPAIFRDFPQFRTAKDWLGYQSLRHLTSALLKRQPDLHIVEGDPSWRVAMWQTPTPFAPIVSTNGKSDEPKSQITAHLRDRVVDFVRTIVQAAPEPVLMAQVAQQVIAAFDTEIAESNWAGAGTFKDLLQSAEATSGILVATAPNTPGYLVDRARHTMPSAGPPDRFANFPPELKGLARRLNQVIGLPNLTPEEFALVFEQTADVVREQGYNLTITSRTVRDRCIEQNHPVSRANVSFILNGITVYAGHTFGLNPHNDTPRALAAKFEQNVLTLCANAQLALSAEERQQLHLWMAGKLHAEQAWALGELNGIRD